jgi:tRNA-dihydrouridine synthase
MKLHLAPLQGYTTADSRNLHAKYFGGIDKYYSPYLRFEPDKALKKSVLKDILPENNEKINFVPQVLGTDTDLFIQLAKQFENYGYTEINWNLGCPYPMVTKRGFGSALLQNPEKVKQILETILPQINIELSIKCRLGFENDNEIFKLIEILNDFPIKEITVHTRTAKQMYKGEANPNAFIPIIEKSKHKLIYNGDIKTTDDITNLNNLFDNKINDFMIGRGLLMNPFLAQEIKGNTFDETEKLKLIREFVNELFEIYSDKLQPSHLVQRMTTHWEYLSFMFESQHKTFKKIKKAKSISKYKIAVNEIFHL